MRKKQFIKRIAEATEISAADVAKVYDAIIESVLSDIQTSGRVKMPDLLTGKIIMWSARAERQHYLPATGQWKTIQALPPRKRVKLKLISKVAKVIGES